VVLIFQVENKKKQLRENAQKMPRSSFFFLTQCLTISTRLSVVKKERKIIPQRKEREQLS